MSPGVRTIITGPPYLLARLNLDLLTTAAIRDCLKVRAHLLRVGISPDYAAVETLTIIIQHYRMRVGLSVYVSQMLGDMGQIPIGECQLYWLDGSRIETPMKGEQPVLRFIKRKFRADGLPFRVVSNEETRYL